MMQEQTANPPIGKMIDKQTLLLGYIAEMATSSRVPKLFGKYFEQNGDNGTMVGMNIREDDLLFTLNGFKTSQLKGALFGAEYMKQAVPAMDHITKEAEIAGFIDACVVQNGKLIGHIASGTATAALMVPKASKRVAIWGAGALATSIILNLDEKGFEEVVIYVDRVESAMELIEKVSPYVTKLRFDIERASRDMAVAFENFDYIVNATSGGLFDHDKALNFTAEPSVTLVDFAQHKASVHSLFESKALEAKADYIGGFDILAQAAQIHYSVWFEKEPELKLMQINRG